MRVCVCVCVGQAKGEEMSSKGSVSAERPGLCAPDLACALLVAGALRRSTSSSAASLSVGVFVVGENRRRSEYAMQWNERIVVRTSERAQPRSQEATVGVCENAVYIRACARLADQMLHM